MGTAKPALKSGNEQQPPPDRLVPASYRPPNSIVHNLSDGERWESVASRYGIDVNLLIRENFKTNAPAEINWYLNHYVGCDTPTPDGYNWRFSTSARSSGAPRAGILYIPQQQPTPLSSGAELLAKDADELRVWLKDFHKTMRTAQESLNEISCTIATEAFKRRGMTTNKSLSYMGKDLGLTLGFIECFIIKSPRIGPFTQAHPNASHSNPSSPIGDIANLQMHPDYHFQAAVKAQGLDVDKDTRGAYDWSTRTIHLLDTASFGQALHEGIHTFSAGGRMRPGFMTVLGSFLYEGATQHFTDMVLEDHGWDKAGRHDYKSETRCAARLVRDFGLTMVANAYFKEQLKPLGDAIALRLRVGLHEVLKLAQKQDNKDRRRGHVLCERLGY